MSAIANPVLLGLWSSCRTCGVKAFAARALSQRSSERRRALLQPDVEQELGALETRADAKRWIQKITIWGVAKRIPGTVANGAASLLREWVKLHDLQDVEAKLKARIEQQSTRIHELERELARAKRRTG